MYDFSCVSTKLDPLAKGFVARREVVLSSSQNPLLGFALDYEQMFPSYLLLYYSVFRK